MITIHHLNNSRSQRILWLMEELGAEYKVEHYQRHARSMRAPQGLRKLHPLGKSPVITDGDAVVAESGAIVEYLLDKFPNDLRPQEQLQDFRYWLHYAEGSLMLVMVLGLVISKLNSKAVPFFFRPLGGLVSSALHKEFLDGEYRSHLTFLSNHLKERQWLLGERFSAVDIMLHMPLAGYDVSYGLQEYPRLQQYLSDLQKRPAFTRSIEKGGAFDLDYRN